MNSFQEIVNFIWIADDVLLDEANPQIEAIKMKIRKQTPEVQEYSTVLISAVVTGKIDVEMCAEV
ncbi:MAG TPA: hypothetical protein VG675_22670 [Bryobacteraceae bacterium]|nr:hypothetical protein [Bryobacteraceae bacterium]